MLPAWQPVTADNHDPTTPGLGSGLVLFFRLPPHARFIIAASPPLRRP